MACSLVEDLIVALGSTSTRVGTIMVGNVVKMIMTQSSTGGRVIGMIMACSLDHIMVAPAIERTLVTVAIPDTLGSLVIIVVTPVVVRHTREKDMTPAIEITLITGAVFD